MDSLKIGLIQLRSSTHVDENIRTVVGHIKTAAEAGCAFILTPEMTNIFDAKADQLASQTFFEKDDPSLIEICALAREYKVHILLGSFAFKSDDGRHVNRSLLIDSDGNIIARYNKIHMFDVDLSDTEFYRESALFKPGDAVEVVETPFGTVGLSICFDLRFPELYFALAKKGASIICVPSAFTKTTGEAHWHILLRARAIETGCFILAPAQGGKHEKGRQTFGHSLVVSPWGEIISDSKMQEGVITAVLDLNEVAKARKKMPMMAINRPVHNKVVKT